MFIEGVPHVKNIPPGVYTRGLAMNMRLAILCL